MSRVVFVLNLARGLSLKRYVTSQDFHARWHLHIHI
nr:MAG TPA: hypothetical protein [Caudoviricetes sp.]